MTSSAPCPRVLQIESASVGKIVPRNADAVSFIRRFCPPLSQRIQLSSICSERNALPRTAIRGRAAGDRIEPTLSHLWLHGSVIASASSSDPDGCRNTWFAQQGGVDEDDTD